MLKNKYRKYSPRILGIWEYLGGSMGIWVFKVLREAGQWSKSLGGGEQRMGTGRVAPAVGPWDRPTGSRGRGWLG